MVGQAFSHTPTCSARTVIRTDVSLPSAPELASRRRAKQRKPSAPGLRRPPHERRIEVLDPQLGRRPIPPLARKPEQQPESIAVACDRVRAGL
jgi:hypothetical protein